MTYPSLDEYPKRIKVRDKYWRVNFSDQPILYGKGKPLRGLADPNTRTIDLADDMGRAKTFRTFCHEVMHAFEWEYGIKIPHALIYALERPIARFVVANFFNRRRAA